MDLTVTIPSNTEVVHDFTKKVSRVEVKNYLGNPLYFAFDETVFVGMDTHKLERNQVFIDTVHDAEKLHLISDVETDVKIKVHNDTQKLTKLNMLAGVQHKFDLSKTKGFILLNEGGGNVYVSVNKKANIADSFKVLPYMFYEWESKCRLYLVADQPSQIQLEVKI